MRITDNEGFDIFNIRDDKILKEENDAKESDGIKSKKKTENVAETENQKKTAEIIKLVLLVLILITSSVTMFFAIRIYYTQSETQNLVFLESVMEKTDNSFGDIVVDTADDIDVGEIPTTQVYVNLSPEVVQQPNNSLNNNSSTNNKVTSSDSTTVKTETVVTTSAVTTTEKSDGRININFASKELLMTLDGIGEKKANAIIAYRNENGAFLSVDELIEVDGIGEKTLEKLRPYVTVD